MIYFEINTQDVQSLLEGIVQKLENRRALMNNLARILGNAVDDNFAANGRPGWQALKYPRVRGGSGILQSSGILRNSIHTQADNDTAVIGTNIKYAAIHHFGGQTRPHLIRPKNGKALKFGGRFAKKVNHPGSKMPARPFMVLQPEDEQDLADAVRDYLARAIGD